MHDVGDLLDVLDLRQIGASVFEGRNGALDLPRVFGGQLVAQALVAAARTVAPPLVPQSLHATFLRPGRSGLANRFEVAHRSSPRTTVFRSASARGVLRSSQTASSSRSRAARPASVVIAARAAASVGRSGSGRRAWARPARRRRVLEAARTAASVSSSWLR
ncbi:acyl-CoA thioesterase domain-containing protein [Dactylosporangium sp. CA-052675]|uniref:acyl-CoA thioesterase domain-containing protein n=1 Tax=Dactylosporangium sp. CA-052675 TaxID=3239927 RepID=UPI003D92353D